MKKTVFVLVWSILLSSFAGTVEWNKAFVMSWEDYSGVHDQSVTIGAPSFLPTWGDRIEGGWRLTAIPGSYMEYANTFVLSYLGDLVYADYINNQSQYFSYAKFGDENSGRTDYYLDILVDNPVYIAFQNEFAGGDSIWLVPDRC